MRFSRRVFSVLLLLLIFGVSTYTVAHKVLADWSTDLQPPTTTLRITCKDASGNPVSSPADTTASGNGSCPATATKATVIIYQCVDDTPSGSGCAQTNYIINSVTQTAVTVWPSGGVDVFASTPPSPPNTPPSTNPNRITVTSIDNAGNNETLFTYDLDFKYSISGILYNDMNVNGTYEAGTDTLFSGGTTVNLTGAATATTTSAANGTYTFTDLLNGSYTVTVPIPSGYKAVVSLATMPIVISFGSASGKNFLVQGYTISGNVYKDNDKSEFKDNGEVNYGTTPLTNGEIENQIQIQSLLPITTLNGTFTSGSLPGGTYAVTHVSSTLPTGYFYTYPLAVGYSVTIGSGCVSSAHITCSSGDVQGLNFGITNSKPWWQCIGSDCRSDPGIINKIPSNPSNPSNPPPVCSNGAYASTPGSFSLSPGIIFSGNSTPDFGQGQASALNWQVGGSAPNNETFSPVNGNLVRTSYDYYDSLLKQNNITPTDLSTVSGCTTLSNCTIPNTLATGVYRANGQVTTSTTDFVLAANRKVVILVNGDLIIKNKISVPTGSSLIFSVKGSIKVDKTVQAASNSDTNTQIQGYYSADKDFIIDGYTATGCVTPPKDVRLNIAGSVVVNAGRQGGTFTNNRDLCASNLSCPAYTITERPDFLLFSPEFIKVPTFVWQETAP